MTTRALQQSKKAKAPFLISGPGRYRTRDGDIVTLTAYTDKESIHYKAGHRWRFGPCESQVVTDAGLYFVAMGTSKYDIIARATKPRTPAKPKAARRYTVAHLSNGWCVGDPDTGDGKAKIHAQCMTRSTARKLAAMLSAEGK